ncbi:MAG: F0F1 ATP synthase subunit A [Reyranellaceae bacterium]
MASPLQQFEIKTLTPLFEIGGTPIGITNSALAMIAAVGVASLFLGLGMRRAALVPGRWQSMVELSYEFIANMLRENVGSEGRRYFPFIFSLFMFVLFGNLLGMIPYSFTFTSHLAVTFVMAAVVFVAVTIIGFAHHGLHYFRMLFPHGAPLWTAVILVPIELVSYLSRPISLSVRLFANMTVGHVMLKVLAGFVVALGLIGGWLPLAALVGITALELLIAVLQAYIFTILSCIYLNDAIHMH